MKQAITKKQWNELSDNQKIKFWGAALASVLLIPTIGRMIEFLGKDFLHLCRMETGYWGVETISKEFLSENNPVDCLWEACKYKLKEDKNETIKSN